MPDTRPDQPIVSRQAYLERGWSVACSTDSPREAAARPQPVRLRLSGSQRRTVALPVSCTAVPTVTNSVLGSSSWAEWSC
jgi:hypothetical protein